MLNYIWAALIVLSFGFALTADVGDAASDRFRNGQPVAVTLSPTVAGEELAAALKQGEVPITVAISHEAFEAHYRAFASKTLPEDEEEDAAPPEDVALPAMLLVTQDGAEVRFAEDAELPGAWAEMDAYFRKYQDAEFFRAELVEPVADFSDETLGSGGATSGGLSFEPVRLRKMQAIVAKAFDLAKWSVTFAIGLVGVLCLWLGMAKIAEDAGLVFALVKVVRPLLGFLFPEIPKDHPAMGMIALNLAANALGLGNAATPMGIKAMEELQKLNPTDDTATNSMCMFLAVNTASVQLVPPATLVAIMGVSTGKLWIPILIVTGLSLLIAITAAKALSLVPVFSESDPMKRSPETPASKGGGA